MNVMKVGARGRVALGALAIVLITASMPAGAIPAGEELKPVNAIVNLYDESHPDAGKKGNGAATAYVNVANVSTSVPDRGDLQASAGQLSTSVDTRSRVAELFAGVNRSDTTVPAWREASRGAHGGALGGDYRLILGEGEPHKDAPRDGGPGGTVEGILGLAGYYLRSHERGSFAEMDAATGWMRAHRFGLVSDIGSRGLISTVNGLGAGAKAALTVEGLQINLNDLFPEEHVELPLGLTLDLATTVSLPGGETAELAFQRLLEAERRVDALARVVREADSVQADVEPLVATMPGYQAAKAARDNAENALFDAKDQLVNAGLWLTQKLAESEQANQAVAQANALYGAAMQDLQIVVKHIQSVQAQMDQVKADIEKLEEEKELLAVVPSAPVQANPGAGDGVLSILSRRGARWRALRQMLQIDAELAALAQRLKELSEDLASSQIGEQLLSMSSVTLAEELDLAGLAASTADAEAVAAELANSQAQALVDQLQEDLAGSEAALDAFLAEAANTDDKVNARVDRLQELSTELVPLVQEARTAAVDLAALLPIYRGLSEALKPWPLFKIDAISYELDTRVTDTTAGTTVRCGLEGVQLLGEDLSIDTCQDLRDEREHIERSIQDFLAQFTVTPPDVRLDLPTASTQVRPVIDGSRQALGTLAGLGLHIGAFQVRDLSTPVVERINALVDEIQVSRTMDEVREIADVQGAVPGETPWDLSWLPEQRDGGRELQMQSAGPRYSVAASNSETEQDVDEELDGFQGVLQETNGDEEVTGQGTAPLDVEVGELGTDVTWAGCEDCGSCVVGSPDCAGDPCEADPSLCERCNPLEEDCGGGCTPGTPGCGGGCTPGAPGCGGGGCPAGSADCSDIECLPGVACVIGEPCLPDVPGCVDGIWRGVPGSAGSVRAGAGEGGLSSGDGSGGRGDGAGGAGSGSDGVPVSDVVGDGSLPHTGGRPATLLLGLFLLLAAMLLRARPSGAR